MLSDEAKQARREYKRNYNRANSDYINAYQRIWRKDNPEKVKEYQSRYWQKKAQQAREAKS